MKQLPAIGGVPPHFIKAVPVSRGFAQTAGSSVRLVHTGQHFDEGMSEAYLEELGIRAPAHHLGINIKSHGAITDAMLQAIEGLLLTEKPNCMSVYSDTNSTMAGALATVKLRIPIAHAEAGIRSFKRRMPDKHNRVLTDRLPELLYAHRQREGVPDDCQQ